MTQYVFLVPGFFGFSSFGRLKYFNGVGPLIQNELSKRDMDVRVIEIDTLPTASIRRRAARVLDVVSARIAGDPGPIHLVGHSTGGLDARLLVCPDANLHTEAKHEVFQRVRSLVTVATPHFGTPLARAFGGALGRPVLELMAVILVYILEHGRLPLDVALKAGRLVARLDDYVGLKDTVADEVFDKLLGELGDEERNELLGFLDGVRHDQSLLFQLTEAGCDLLNATTGNPDRLHFASVATCAPKPRLKNIWTHVRDPYAQSLHAIFGGLYFLARRTDPRFLPQLTEAAQTAFRRDLGHVPAQRDNDGVVPTLAQVWGKLLGAARADHLDVIGHFGDPTLGTSTDWFPSSSGFSRNEFERLWRTVAEFIAKSANGTEPPNASS